MRKQNLNELPIQQPQEGMICYESYNAAYRVLVCLRKNGVRHGKICRCQYCDYFHIGFEFVERPVGRPVQRVTRRVAGRHSQLGRLQSA